MKLVTNIALLIACLALAAPVANAMSAKDKEKVVSLFTDTSIPAERSTEAMNEGDAPYKIIHLRFTSGGQKYSAKLFLSKGVQSMSVDVLYEDYAYNVDDINGDGIVDEVSNSIVYKTVNGDDITEGPLNVDEKTVTELSVLYRKTIHAMLVYYKANKK